MVKRLRLLFVGEDTALLLFTGKARITNIPEGASIYRVGYSYMGRGFEIMIEHDSFELVRPGEWPKSFPAEVEMID